MLRRPSARRSAIVISVGALLAGANTGCVTDSHSREEACPPNKTLVCTERIGKVESCACTGKDKLRDILVR